LTNKKYGPVRFCSRASTRRGTRRIRSTATKRSSRTAIEVEFGRSPTPCSVRKKNRVDEKTQKRKRPETGGTFFRVPVTVGRWALVFEHLENPLAVVLRRRRRRERCDVTEFRTHVQRFDRRHRAVCKNDVIDEINPDRLKRNNVYVNTAGWKTFSVSYRNNLSANRSGRRPRRPTKCADNKRRFLGSDNGSRYGPASSHTHGIIFLFYLFI